MNKKGDFASFLFVIAALFAVGVLLFFAYHFFTEINSEFDDYLSADSDYNNTEAHQALTTYQTTADTIWDYAFLGIAIAYVLGLIFTAFSTRISPIFFWVYIILAMVGLIVGVMLSNTWQELAEDKAFVNTIDNFPITDTLLGTYYPMFITFIMIIFIILLFGKPLGGQGT